MAGEENIIIMKRILRESDIPFFTDDELQFYLDHNGGNLNNALYQCLCIKADDTPVNVSGLNLGDMSKYFRRLANMYRPNNSGILEG